VDAALHQRRTQLVAHAARLEQFAPVRTARRIASGEPTQRADPARATHQRVVQVDLGTLELELAESLLIGGARRKLDHRPGGQQRSRLGGSPAVAVEWDGPPQLAQGFAAECLEV
jgi:hypothetical protein